MAVVWPDFSTATVTDAESFESLQRAYAERCAAACAGTGRAVSLDAEYGGWDDTPVLDRLIRFRKAMTELAAKFVRLYDERYALKSFSKAPIAYEAADLMRGEHSLAVLPERATPEGDSERLADYRAFLGNCAWWLKRFRYVNVASQSFFTRKSAAMGYDRSGEPVENLLAAPVHEDLSGRNTVRVSDCWMISFNHEAQWSAEDVYDSQDKQWRYDAFVDESEKIDATAYSGMIVRNGSGLAGRLILMPTFYDGDSGAFPSKNIDREQIETIIPDSPGDFVTGFYAGKCHNKTERFEKHGTEWLQTYDRDFRGEQWWGKSTETSSTMERDGHCVYVTTSWSDDGTRSYTTREEMDLDDWYNYSIRQWSKSSIRDFDGFGEWTLGKPVEYGLVEPHDRVEPIPKIETLPKPNVWDLRPFDPDPVRIHPRNQLRNVYCQTYLRLIPILDFNQSYQYQDT